MRTPEASPQADGSVRYIVRFRHGASKADATKRRQTSEGFDTLKDAEAFALRLDLLGAQAALEWLYNGEQKQDVPDLDQVAADHLRVLEGVSPGYRLKEQKRWANCWSPRIGRLPADAVTRDHLRLAMQDLADNGMAPGKGYSRKSLANCRGLLHGVMDRCVELKYQDRNPARRLALPDGHYSTGTAIVEHDDDDDEKVFLSLAEFKLLYEAVAPHYQPLVRFLAGTGLRWSEATALQVRDLNLDGPMPCVRVRRAWKDSGGTGELILGPPKTKKGRRDVTLGSVLVDELRELTRGKGDRDWIFVAPKGGVIRHRSFWDTHWRPALFRAQHCAAHTEARCLCGTASMPRCPLHGRAARKADPSIIIPKPCRCAGTLTVTPRIHDLRHSHASWLIERGYDMKVIQDRLGHESIKTTYDTYGHIRPAMRLAAASAADFDLAGPDVSAPALAAPAAPAPDPNAELRELLAELRALKAELGTPLLLASASAVATPNEMKENTPMNHNAETLTLRQIDEMTVQQGVSPFEVLAEVAGYATA